MEQSYYSSSTSNLADQARDNLGTAASEFSRSIQEATGKLVGAAEQFSTMTDGLTNAVNEVRAASAKAQEAQKAAEEAKAAAEAVLAKMDRDYSNLKGLMSDLQERIGALAILARPLNLDAEPETPAQAAEDATENSLETSAEGETSAVASVPSPDRWRGWQG